MEIVIVDKNSGWVFQYDSANFKTLSELRERIGLSISLRKMPEVSCEDMDILMTRIDRVYMKNYKAGSGHCDRFDVYAILL